MEPDSATPAGEETPRAVEVPLAALAELAVDWWRLDRRLNSAPPGGARPDGAGSHTRHAARRLSKFLTERELSVLDLTGRRYEPGLAVEVVDVERDETLQEGEEVVAEVVSPIVLWRGTVVRHGQVIIRQNKNG